MLKLSKKISDIMFFGLVPLAVLSAVAFAIWGYAFADASLVWWIGYYSALTVASVPSMFAPRDGRIDATGRVVISLIVLLMFVGSYLHPSVDMLAAMSN
jgi:hypothetical protein